jgi:signal transduction histidine kinase/ActR/RegA family two-component response regulator
VQEKVRFRLHALAIALVAIIVSGSVVGFVVAQNSVRRSNELLLKQDAAQGALVLSGFVSTLEDPYQRLGQNVTPIGATPSTFDAAAAQVAGTSHEGIALLHQVGDHLAVLASVGSFRRTFGSSGDRSLITTYTKQPNRNFIDIFDVGKAIWTSQVYSKGTVPPGFAIYVEAPLGLQAGSVTQLPGLLFGGIDAAVYLGSTFPGNLALQTTGNVPTAGTRAVSIMGTGGTLDTSVSLTSRSAPISAPDQFIVVMKARQNLVGASSADFPWILLGLGLLAAVLAGVLLSIALTRRDQALVLVDDLEKKNAELDDALNRQAQAEKNLRQVQRMEAVGQLAGGIAHDFNNLLHVILSYSGFLAESVGADGQLQADVAEVQKAARRAAELTRQLLVFSRLDVTRPTVLDVNDVVRDSERLLRHTLGEDIDLRCETSDVPCYLRADAGELDQVLMNLAINARDAMPQGGNLGIVVRRVTSGTPEADQTNVVVGPQVRIDVTDDGDGMRADVAAKAFEPFFTTKETGRGTGLGLAMVYGIVSRWGGTASIATSPGLGTTVTLFFPVSIDGPALEVNSTVEEQPSGGREVVLLVEDEEGVRHSTARVLEAAGYRVLQAQNGSEGLAIFGARAIDVLVTDVIMPGGVSGKELADRVTRDHPGLPVIFVSGYGAETIAERGILSTTTTLIKKPFAPTELLEAIRHALAERTPTRR